MAKFKSAAYLDGGPDLLRTRAGTSGRLQTHLLSAYSAGDSYSTCSAASLGSVNLSTGDITTANGSSSSRVTTIASKTITLTGSASGTPDLHLAVLDTVSSEVHWVTPDNTDPASVASGGTVTTGAMTDTISQPT